MSKAETFIQSWMSHRQALLELLERLSDEHLNFRPWEKGMSLSELVLHISASSEMFSTIVQTGSFKQPASHEVNSVSELKQVVQAETDDTKNKIAPLSDEHLEQTAEFNGMKMSGAAMLEMLKEHEIHHKGQLFTYARLIGIQELPFFISR